jgi:murein DD-endopeptidase MepM/ murein hydrolase activator NlpD
VETGFISSKFGEQPHPVLKGIMVNNQGVDIQTNSNALVKSVFTGKVATVAFVPGMNSVIILQHGDYYTVYSRLKKVNVKKGQEITTGEVIGEVYTDNQGVTEVQFQVWKSSTKLDPEKWLSSK